MTEPVKLSYVTLRGAPSKTGKTSIWDVENSKDGRSVGAIKWFGKWRKYAFYPAPDCVFEQVCLREIAGFLESQRP
jgi:hypothetical protein